jgi:hypothetical protein
MARSSDPGWLLNARTLNPDEHAPPTYQTVRLSPGRHRSPEEGACALELASMLKGRPFSDRVYCVDPAIMAFVWGYHDHISDDLRQRDLYRVAALILDTRRDDELAARRAEMCRVWALQARSLRRRPVLLRGKYLRVLWRLQFERRERVDLLDCELAGAYAATMARADRPWHAATLRFLEMLVWLGRGADDLPSLALPTGRSEAPQRRDEDAPPRSPSPLAGARS